MSPRSAVGILVIAFFVFNIVMYNKAQKVRRALSRIEYKYYCEYRISYRSLGRNCWQARARDALTGRLARVWRASPSRLDATSGVSAGQAEEGTLQSKNSTLVHEDSITPLHTARRTAAHRCADTRANRAVVSCQIGAKKARKLKAKGAGGISQGPSID